MQKYVNVPKNDTNSNVENSWFHTCREKKIPFVTIKSRTKFADVHWDYIAFPTHVDAILESRAAYIRDTAVSLFTKYASRKSKCSVSGHLVWYQDLDLDKASSAAEELYDLIASCIETKGNV